MPTVREYEAALQRNPADTEAFVALRKAYRQAQKHDRLVTLYETRAQAIEDNAKAGELFYLAAELRIDQLGDAEGAEADLVNAVDRDPGHIRAAARLKDIYREQGRTADYMTMLEMEAAAVARTRDPARIAELEAEMGQLFLNHFAKLERAVRNPQRQGKLAPEHLKSIESARKIYRALGDYRAVVRLYELELEGTTDARRRADLLLGLGRVLVREARGAGRGGAAAVGGGPHPPARREGAGAAGGRLRQPELDRRRRHRARGGDLLPGRAAAAGGGRHRERDRLAAQGAAGGPRPHRVVRAARARLLRRAPVPGARSLLPRAGLGGAPPRPERVDFLYKRAQLAEGELGRSGRGAARSTTRSRSSSRRAARPPRSWSSSTCQGHDYAKLAELRERQLGAVAEPATRARIMLRAGGALPRPPGRRRSGGRLPARGAGDRAREPGRARRLRRALPREGRLGGAGRPARVLLRAGARGAARPPRSCCRGSRRSRSVTEKQLGDPERALLAWQRAEEIAPTYGRAREAQRRILLKAKSWDRLAALLEREAARAEPTRRRGWTSCAGWRSSTARSWGTPSAPSTSTARSCAPIRTTRSRCARWSRSTSARATSPAWRTRCASRSSCTTSKQERVGLLRRVLVIYDERTGDLVQGQWAAGEILQAVPGDRDTLTRLERILERAGQPADLVRVLDLHAKHAANPDEKLQLFRRIAEILYSKLQDPTGAAARLEEVVRLDPDDAKALAGLEQIYTALGRHEDLARVLDMEVERVIADAGGAGGVPAPAGAAGRGVAAATSRARARPGSSCRISCRPTPRRWRRWRGSTPPSRTGRCWSASSTGRRRSATEPGRAVELALQRAQIFDEKLRDVDAAAEALERLIAEIDPRNVEAHARLRALLRAGRRLAARWSRSPSGSWA